MSFKIQITGTGQQAVIQLFDSSINCTVEVFSFGALLNKFAAVTRGEELNVIDGFTNVQDAVDTMTPAFKSAKLSPFVCRVNEGKYNYNGQNFELTKYSMGKNAIHGLVYDEVFDVVETFADENSARVKLAYQYAKTSQGYPFKFTCEVVYELFANSSLNVITTITNDDDKAIPVADGWHPYFTLGDPINDCEFLLSSNQMLEFDDELIPTGKLIPYSEFNQIKQFGTTWFDNCFTVNFREGQPACIVRNKKRKIEVQIHPSTSYPYLQFYTPDHRQSIAIENLSAAPDAFNNNMGLKIIEANESATFKTTFVIKPL